LTWIKTSYNSFDTLCHANNEQQRPGLLQPLSFIAQHSQRILPKAGVPQGDTPSPMNWNAVLDVLLRALHDIDPTPYLIRTDSALHPLADTAYADYIFSISARREGLQLKADTFRLSSSFSESK